MLELQEYHETDAPDDRLYREIAIPGTPRGKPVKKLEKTRQRLPALLQSANEALPWEKTDLRALYENRLARVRQLEGQTRTIIKLLLQKGDEHPPKIAGTPQSNGRETIYDSATNGYRRPTIALRGGIGDEAVQKGVRLPIIPRYLVEEILEAERYEEIANDVLRHFGSEL